MVKHGNMTIFFSFDDAQQLASSKIFIDDLATSFKLEKYCSLYTQPNYNSTEPRLVRSAGFDRNIKFMCESHLFYTTPAYSLVSYNMNDLNNAIKSGSSFTPEAFEVKECIQGFDFLNKVFSFDRIVVLTADGRVIKGKYAERKWVVKRDVALPDQIDTNIIFTEIITVGDSSVVAGYNVSTNQNLLVMLSRTLDTVDRCALTEQGSHISKLQLLEFKGKSYLLALNQFKSLNLVLVGEKLQIIDQQIQIGECKYSLTQTKSTG